MFCLCTYKDSNFIKTFIYPFAPCRCSGIITLQVTMCSINNNRSAWCLNSIDPI